jgi:hypothetical protein
MPDQQEAELSIVVTDDTDSEGGKGFFSNAENLLKKVEKVTPEKLQESMSNFVQTISKIFKEIQPIAAGTTLDKIEISVEMTAKGEIRLIASGGMETKGAIKLTFKHR